MKKKWLTAVFAAAVVSLFLINPLPSWSAEKGPIKIGFFSPLSGGMAAKGKDMLAGAQLYLEEIKYQAAGRKIELIVEDDEANPAVGLTKSRKLVEKDGVHLMTGGLMASTAYAIAPYIDSKEIPMTYPIMSADDITQRKVPKWIVRTGWSSSQPHQPFGEYAYNILKFRKVSIVAYDFAFGWECVGGFHKTFEDAGGKVLQKIWVPMTAQDMSPYLSQISKDADAVFAVFSGRSDAAVREAVQGIRPQGQDPPDRRRDGDRRARPPLHGGRSDRNHHPAHLQRGRWTTRPTRSSSRRSGRRPRRPLPTIPRGPIRGCAGSSKRSKRPTGTWRTGRRCWRP